jgi:hypothetical protein
MLGVVDRDRMSDSVGLALRHVGRRVRSCCACPVRAVDRSLEGVTEHRRLARLNPFEHDLVGLDEVVDVESQVPHTSVTDQLAAQLRGKVLAPSAARITRQLNTNANADAALG